MLVEINLLPKKEPKNILFAILIAVVGLFFAAGCVYLYWTLNNNQQKVEHLEHQIQSVQQLAVLEQKKQGEEQKKDSLSELQALIDWSEKYPVKTVPLIRELVALLPERGFFMAFSYTADGSVQLTVQFDSSSQSAQYLNELLHSKWIADAKLSSLSTSAAIKDSALETKSNEKPEGEKDESDKAESSLTGKHSDSEEKKKKSQLLGNEPYLPRYTAQFELALNKEFMQKQEQAKENAPKDKEGNDAQ
ncbi:PilN domain-containing protein [Bacillus sp. 1P06AnD]|uniref:PilN domain-containing protein n=1 Tax=Bacillus sp. 1P06AnD TaxID=3132208 RepID=UPI0039A26889